MNTLSDDLLTFAHAIIHGKDLPPEAGSVYPAYSATTAIEVYRNNYYGNLHDALAGAYPVIEQLVGKEFFWMLTRQFIGQHHSGSGNLHHYGVEMANFIADFEPAQGLVYLADIASLEWACHCAYFAPDADALDFGRLSQVSQDKYSNLVLITHPACHVVPSRFPIAEIWHAHQPGTHGDFHIELDSGPSTVVVSRKDDAVLAKKISEADSEWLTRVKAGTTLGEATVSTLERFPNFDLQSGLSNLVTQGVFADFYVKGLP